MLRPRLKFPVGGRELGRPRMATEDVADAEAEFHVWHRRDADRERDPEGVTEGAAVTNRLAFGRQSRRRPRRSEGCGEGCSRGRLSTAPGADRGCTFATLKT